MKTSAVAVLVLPLLVYTRSFQIPEDSSRHPGIRIDSNHNLGYAIQIRSEHSEHRPIQKFHSLKDTAVVAVLAAADLLASAAPNVLALQA